MSDMPDKVWINECNYSQASTEPALTGIEYTRTDAITPQQAAEVLLRNVTGGSIHPDVAMKVLNAVQNVQGLKAFNTALKALSQPQEKE